MKKKSLPELLAELRKLTGESKALRDKALRP